jgi:uncharacterized protein
MQPRTVVHFEIPASDTSRLSQFYEDVFGWKFQKVDMAGMEYWLIETGPQGKSIGGGMYPREGPDDRPRNFIGVDDIDAAITSFTTAGGRQVVQKMEIPNGMGWSYVGADPEGNMIALWQPGAMSPQRQRARPERAARAKPSSRARPKARPKAKKTGGKRRR